MRLWQRNSLVGSLLLMWLLLGGMDLLYYIDFFKNAALVVIAEMVSAIYLALAILTQRNSRLGVLGSLVIGTLGTIVLLALVVIVVTIPWITEFLVFLVWIVVPLLLSIPILLFAVMCVLDLRRRRGDQI